MAQVKGAYELGSEEADDARTRSSTYQKTQQMSSKLKAQAKKFELQNEPSKPSVIKIKHKIICAIASKDNNENVDLWLNL